MKNNVKNYQKIAIKIASRNKKSFGFVSLDQNYKLNLGFEIAKECAKIKNTVFINFTDEENYPISDIESMIKKEENLSIINISITKDLVNLINSDIFRKLINNLNYMFDLILINETIDISLAYALSSFDDEKILIAKENKTKKSTFITAMKEFKDLSSPIMGVIYYI